MSTEGLAGWLLERLAEDEAVARAAMSMSPTPWRTEYGRQVGTADGYLVTPEDEWSTHDEPVDDTAQHIARHDPERVLREVAAKRAVVELHQSWPVLVDTPPSFSQSPGEDPDSLAVCLSKQVAWMTEREYRDRFGSEPPTAPMLRAIAQIYAGAEGWREEWAL